MLKVRHSLSSLKAPNVPAKLTQKAIDNFSNYRNQKPAFWGQPSADCSETKHLSFNYESNEIKVHQYFFLYKNHNKSDILLHHKKFHVPCNNSNKYPGYMKKLRLLSLCYIQAMLF